MSFEQVYGVKDPQADIEYDVTDELILEEMALESAYEDYLHEKQQELKYLLQGAYDEEK